jgi:hypothetical protein
VTLRVELAFLEAVVVVEFVVLNGGKEVLSDNGLTVAGEASSGEARVVNLYRENKTK